MTAAAPENTAQTNSRRPAPLPPQLAFIPHISSPTTNWRRDGNGEAVFKAPAYNTDSLMGWTPTPGQVDWLHQSACFSYAAPTESQEAKVEGVFRRCKYDARCASTELWEMTGDIDAHEELLSWWCRRCWEDRRTSEVGETVKRWAGDRDVLARAFLLSSWCRFSTTARRAGQHASAITGGSPGLLRLWQRCREARGRPSQAAAEASECLRESGSLTSRADEAVDVCCADTRCLARALEDCAHLRASSIARRRELEVAL